MPYILESPDAVLSTGLSQTKYEYKYPEGLNWDPNGTLHKDILSKLMLRVQESSTVISKRWPSWKKIDRTLTTYIYTDDAETSIKDADERKPVSIVVPYSYATLETLLTYFVSTFLDDPVFRYEGVSPEDVLGARLLEKVVEFQSRRAKFALALYVMFRDSLAYGIGQIAPVWSREMGYRTVKEPQGFMSSFLSRWIDLGMGKRTEEIVKYEGNRLVNIDPYNFLPDPNAPIHDVQRGEFVGWIEETNYMKLMEQEKDLGGMFFNVRYLNNIGSGSSKYTQSRTSSGREDKFGGSSGRLYGSSSMKPIDVIYLYVTLIPKEWKLSTSEYPEKWLFGIGADKVIIRAQKLGLDHNMYPVAVCAPTFDGYSIAPISKIEVIYGLQETLDWLFSSHVANVRKAINDMIVVDPSMINMLDMKNPEPGKLIRLRRAAWGKDVRSSIFQLNVQDITSRHIQDANYIVELIKQVSSSQDSLMGIQRETSDRVTAAEVRQTGAGALSRLASAAKIASVQAMSDLAYMTASHTQQLMSEDQYIKVAGEWVNSITAEYNVQNGRMKVSPFDLLVDYDVVLKDASSTAQFADVWMQMFQTIAQQPLLLQRFDVMKIFKRLAKDLGAKDVDEFEIKQIPPVQTTVMPDEQVMREAEKGNVIPFQGG